LGRHLATSAVTRSNPGDFLSEYFCIVCLISLGVKNFSGGLIGGGMLKKLVTTLICWGKNISCCGWNVSCRCVLNSSALPKSEKAYELLGLINGIEGVLYWSIFFVSFHKLPSKERDLLVFVRRYYLLA